MRLIPYILLTFIVATASAGETVPMQSRPHTMKCQPSVNVWIEVDSHSLTGNKHALAESKKRMPLHLIGSTPARGESVVCSYASRSRDITTSYTERCVYPRKLRRYSHTYSCK